MKAAGFCLRRTNPQPGGFFVSTVEVGSGSQVKAAARSKALPFLE